MKHIGIVAHSAEGATLCYRTVWLEGIKRLGPHRHPEISMTGVAMADVLEHYDSDLDRVRHVFERDAAKLAAAGADFFILPDNTAHIALEREGAAFAVPCQHIGEVVAAAAARQGYKRVGILGTEWTMMGPVYPGAFARRGIEWAVPSATDRSLIHRVIFDELCLGILSDKSRAAYVDVIGKLGALGCDAVALVCTEIPLLVSPEDSPLPLLDSTRLLARSAVEIALGTEPMPAWRGGPL